MPLMLMLTPRLPSHDGLPQSQGWGIFLRLSCLEGDSPHRLND